MELNLESIWAGIASVGAIGGIIWGWIQKQRTVLSENRTKVAEDDRDRELATSAQTLYSMLNDRLKTVELEQKELRMYTRKLELHVLKLEKLMRDNNIEPPMFTG